MSYNLLQICLDNNLKLKTNTEYITKKAAKRLFIKDPEELWCSTDDVLAFYCSVIRPVLEYGAEIWYGGLTQKGIERNKKRALYPNQKYDQVIIEKDLQNPRRT